MINAALPTIQTRCGTLGLPEYARFRGLRCEVQVQTILNHAWAEMAHDTIYKKPALDGFGQRAFEAIEKRLEKVMRDHLIPAGHDFQKIANDFRRLQAGKDVFDQKPVDAVAQAENNNERFDAIERLSEQVLPLFDDVCLEYSAIAVSLVEAAERARETPTTSIESAIGPLDGKTSEEITRQVAEILTRYRYCDVDLTYQSLLKLYVGANSDGERSALKDSSEKLSKNELRI